MSNREKPQWEDKFIGLLSSNPSVALAARGAGIHRTTAYTYRKQSKEFTQRWVKAKAEALEMLEAQAWQRASKTSDTLMIFLLKANKPNKYQERIKILHEFNNAELKLLRQLKQTADSHDVATSDLFELMIKRLAAADVERTGDS